MKSLLMVVSTVVSITIGFVLANTLYEEERSLVYEDGNYFVMQTAPAKTGKLRNTWDDPSRIVY